MITNVILSLNVGFPARIIRFKQSLFRAKNQVHPIWKPGRGDDLAQASVLEGCKIVLDQKQLQISDRTYRLSALKSQPNVVFTLEIPVLRQNCLTKDYELKQPCLVCKIVSTVAGASKLFYCIVA